MAKNIHETLQEQLEDPTFRAEWDALEPEYAVIQAMVNTREASIKAKRESKAKPTKAGFDRVQRQP